MIVPALVVLHFGAIPAAAPASGLLAALLAASAAPLLGERGTTLPAAPLLGERGPALSVAPLLSERGPALPAAPLLGERGTTLSVAPLLSERRTTVPAAPLLGERGTTLSATALLDLRRTPGASALRCAAVRTLCRSLARSGSHARLGALRPEGAGRGGRRHLGTATSALRVGRAGREDQRQCDDHNHNYACVTSHRSYSL